MRNKNPPNCQTAQNKAIPNRIQDSFPTQTLANASKEDAQNGVRREVPLTPGGARRTLCASKEHAQNGVRREVPLTPGGARRTLCASKEHAQNGARREVPLTPGGARRTLCALNTIRGRPPAQTSNYLSIISTVFGHGRRSCRRTPTTVTDLKSGKTSGRQVLIS